MISKTENQYNEVIVKCRDIFIKKTKDYGTAWRILRLSSITDQIYIKAKRIRSIQDNGVTKVDEGIEPEFIGIINYCIIALIQMTMDDDAELELDPAALNEYYEREVQETLGLLRNKNHDYGEAWRDMRVSSITDIILMKIHRTKQIEDNKGQTLISEGVGANYRDMINYAVFCMIKLQEDEAS